MKDPSHDPFFFSLSEKARKNYCTHCRDRRFTLDRIRRLAGEEYDRSGIGSEKCPRFRQFRDCTSLTGPDFALAYANCRSRCLKPYCGTGSQPSSGKCGRWPPFAGTPFA